MTKPKPKIKSLKYALRLLREERRRYRSLEMSVRVAAEHNRQLTEDRDVMAMLAKGDSQAMRQYAESEAKKIRDDILAGRRI